MSRTTTRTRSLGATALGALAITAATVGVLSTTPSQAEPDAGTRAAAAETRAGTTRLTFAVDDCEGCEVQLQQAVRTDRGVRTWESRQKAVEDGEVTFTVRSRRTWGMAATVVAPWEGHTGYRATVAFRYDDHRVADAVTFREARAARTASACWAGTRRDAVTVPLVVEQVEVPGVHGRVAGTIAYTPTTEDWTLPMRRVHDGVLGSQDADVCRR